MRQVRLQVNIDHIATLRQQRGTPYPSVIEAARVCLAAGADGITAHLREDRRHIQDNDVTDLRKVIPKRSVYNLEMAFTQEMADIALAVKPDMITLVPEKRRERTTEGGLVLSKSTVPRLIAFRKKLEAEKIRLSLFIDPEIASVEHAKFIGAHTVEFHTGYYAHAHTQASAKKEIARIHKACTLGHSLGLEIAAGHGLHQGNVKALLLGAPRIRELNIGHGLVSESLFDGLKGTVKSYLKLLT